ncbi:MAG: allantoinase AllB [Cyanobacteria bacterium DS2.3.42]|nr:allantoinase AllB [Cyanobacteria bacterium DS2.3.42]
MGSSAQAFDSAFVGRKVLTEDGFRQAAVLVKDGVIKEIVSVQDVPEGIPVEDAGDLVVIPGLVDCHVHVNEPGRTEWEGFVTATKAAAAGGVTTIVDMPLNCIPVTTTLAALKEKLNAIEGLLNVDCAFWGGVVPGNHAELEKMVAHGVVGFKCFLIHSGIDDFPNATEFDLRKAMPVLAKLGVPLLVHAEMETDCDESDDKPSEHLKAEPRSYAAFLESRPRQWENDAVKLVALLCEEFNCRVHIVHLSSSDALAIVKEAKGKKLPFSAETCPHYLTFAAEEIPDGDTRFKCAPPIREKENSELLWKALKDGTIDFVVSDHSPCTPELKLMKEGDFDKAWGGIASLQFGLPAVWTFAKEKGHSLEDVIGWMSQKTAKFAGLYGTKGKIAPGFDADIVFLDPEASFVVEKKNVHHRHKETPHEGRKFKGVVKRTYVRGVKVYDEGTFTREGHGKKILSGRLDKTEKVVTNSR